MAAPELRLDVRLNLATFRTDLGKAAQAAAAYYYPINLLINKQNLTKQLTAIGRSLGTTQYNINLNDTSVVLAADKVEKLAASLKKLSGSIQIDFNAGGGAKPLGTAMREMAAKLAKESKGDINRAVEQMTGMRGASPFGTGTRSIPGFKAAAKGMGIENAFKLFFQELDRVDPQGLKKALDDGSVMMMQENREIKQKFDKIQSSAEGLARDLRAMGETAQATGKASLTAGGKTLYPQNYGLKIASLLSQVEKLDKDLRRVSTESGGELLDTLTELSSVLRTTSNSFVGIAGFSKNLDETLRGFDIATKAATRATTAYADRINRRGGGPAEATAGPRLLSGREPGGALVAPLRDDPYRVIQAQVKNAFDIIEDYHKRQLNNFTSGYKKIIEDYHRKILIQLASVTEYRPSQKLLGGAPPRLALPPAGGASTPERQVRISTGAYLGQPGFMRAPFVPPSMGGGGGLAGGTGGGTGGGPGNFASRSGGGGGFNMPQLPGSGVVRELGEEFGFATKQVLLFGTAYKALAFLQGFPAQVGNAVSALQSFRNTLNAISPTAVDAAASNQLIIDTVDKYNIPIQSARNGFTKLYASMKPAGFSGQQIGDLFLGISKASATLGLSSDKVDRVTYAFSQMASKGQLMSEEVSGQLGDVIPGALSIMAEAANMDIKTFKKAMEDGVFVGQAFEAVMSNVPIVLEKRFGKGAEGAAKTFQGAINNMQTSLTLLYEAFEPVAVGFLNSVVRPMTDGLQAITDGFNSFFTGQAAQTAGGSAFAKQLNDLKPAFEGILANIQALVPSFQVFGNLLLNAGKLLASLAGNPITGFLLKVYTNILLVNTAFTLLGGKILLSAIASINATIARMVAMTVTMNALGVATTRAGASIAGTQLQMALLQSSAAGAVGPVTALLGSLLRLAAIGTIAIMVTIAISGANELRDAELRLARLRGEKDPVGPEGPKPVLTPSRRFVGATRETVQAAREKQAPLLLQYRQELKVLQQQALTAKAIADASEDNAQASVANTKARAAQARVEAKLIDIQNAQGILNLDPSKYPTAAERQSASVKAMTNIAGGDGGAGGKSTKGAKPETYVSDLARALQKELEIKVNAINQDASLSDREREIQEAGLRYQYEVLINKAEYNAAINDENKKDILNRKQYVADLDKTLKDENELARQRFEDVITKPLRGALDEDRQAIIDLESSIGSLAKGQSEQTYVEQRQALVKKASIGLTEEQIAALKPLFDLLLQTAAARDKLTEAEKRAQEVQEKIKSRNEYIKSLREEIKLLRIIDETERRREELRQQYGNNEAKIQEILDLEKIKKNIEDTRALIGDFVTSTSSDYKGFLKAVISGEDAADALKQFSEGLKDRVLTIFLDFAMAPVEKFMKEAFEKLFRVDRASEIEKLPGTDIDKATETDPVAATNDNTNATRLSTKATENLTTAISNLGGTMVPGTNVPATGFTSPDIEQSFGGGLDFGVQALDLGKLLGGIDLETAFEPLQKNFSATLENLSSTLDANAFSLKDSATDYSESFDSVGGSANKIAEDAGKAAKEAEKNGKDFEASLNYVAGGIAIAGTTIMGIGAGINQMKKGGTGNTLMGIGSILASLGGGIGGFTKLFAANGGVADGGWKPFPVSAFANGGMVSGPTLGLVGEGKYNEAIVPLPDGRSIPVQMQGESIRDKMGGGTAGAVTSPMLSMSFQSTTINGVEYVDRAQLEAAMAETRRMASKEGATRGANLALDKLANSPSSRRRVGIR